MVGSKDIEFESVALSVIDKWFDAYNHHSVEQLVALYHSSVCNTQIPWGRTVQGVDAMRVVYQKLFMTFPDITLKLRNVVSNQSWVAVEWVFSGTMKGEFWGCCPTSKSLCLHGCEIFQIGNGLIYRQTGYWDKSSMCNQLNLKIL